MAKSKKVKIQRETSTGRFVVIGDKRVLIGENSVKAQQPSGDLGAQLKKLRKISEEVLSEPNDDDHVEAEEA